MGVHLKEGDGYGIDLLVVTKEGHDLGGFPRGVIVPAGYTRDKRIRKYLNEQDHIVYKAKHLIDPTEFTHLEEKGGMFNTFGFFLTDEEVIPTDKSKKWTLDAVDKRWFRQVNVDTPEEIEKYVA